MAEQTQGQFHRRSKEIGKRPFWGLKHFGIRHDFNKKDFGKTKLICYFALINSKIAINDI